MLANYDQARPVDLMRKRVFYLVTRVLAFALGLAILATACSSGDDATSFPLGELECEVVEGRLLCQTDESDEPFDPAEQNYSVASNADLITELDITSVADLFDGGNREYFVYEPDADATDALGQVAVENGYRASDVADVVRPSSAATTVSCRFRRALRIPILVCS